MVPEAQQEHEAVTQADHMMGAWPTRVRKSNLAPSLGHFVKRFAHLGPADGSEPTAGCHVQIRHAERGCDVVGGRQVREVSLHIMAPQRIVLEGLSQRIPKYLDKFILHVSTPLYRPLLAMSCAGEWISPSQSFLLYQRDVY